MAHTQDIVERLRDRAYSGLPDPLLAEAADEIERLRAWVNELQLSKVEIDAVQHVVEDGRLVDLADYGRLRSLLIRLRPEWLDDESDEPVAWGAYCDGVYDSSFCGSDAKNEADEWCNELRFEDGRDWIAVPLYRQPQPTLTDAEREAVERVSVAYELLPTEGAKQVAATLRGFLERLK